MAKLKDRLHKMSERGTPLGSSELRERVMVELARRRGDPGPGGVRSLRRLSPRPVVVAVGAAVITLLVVGVIGIGALFSGGQPEVIDQPSTVVTTLPAPTTPSTTTPPDTSTSTSVVEWTGQDSLDLVDRFYRALNQRDLIEVREGGEQAFDPGGLGVHVYDEVAAAVLAYDAEYEWTCLAISATEVACEEQVTDAFYGPVGLIHRHTARYRVDDGQLIAIKRGFPPADGPNGLFLNYLKDFDWWLWEHHPEADWLWLTEHDGVQHIGGQQPCCQYQVLEPDRAAPIKAYVQEFVASSISRNRWSGAVSCCADERCRPEPEAGISQVTVYWNGSEWETDIPDTLVAGPTEVVFEYYRNSPSGVYVALVGLSPDKSTDDFLALAEEQGIGRYHMRATPRPPWYQPAWVLLAGGLEHGCVDQAGQNHFIAATWDLPPGNYTIYGTPHVRGGAGGGAITRADVVAQFEVATE